MNVMTGVGTILCAAHTDKTGRLHGHTWEITAWWPDIGRDAAELRAELETLVSVYDHSALPDSLSRGEDIASKIGLALPDCAQVDVSRAGERIYAKWVRTA